MGTENMAMNKAKQRWSLEILNNKLIINWKMFSHFKTNNNTTIKILLQEEECS